MASDPDDSSGAGMDRALFRLAAVAAALTIAALLIGGLAMAGSGWSGGTAEELLTSIAEQPAWFVAAGVGLTLVSLFDMFTVPALHVVLRRGGPLLITVATGTALVGDLLGVLGRLAQTSAAVAGAGAGRSAGSTTTDLAAVAIFDTLDTVLNTAGFLLVSVSFSCFGLLMLRGFSKPIGWVALVAGGCTALGQIPVRPLQALFAVAMLAYFGWYVGLAVRFGRLARQDAGRRGSGGPARSATADEPSLP